MHENLDAELKTQYLTITPWSHRATVTGIWTVYSVSGENLGKIKWHAPWRRYCYVTFEQRITLDVSCMQLILSFIIDRMNERKAVGSPDPHFDVM